ncbi:ADP-ribosylglycohydrolase [Glycomyces sambucus]|uniref:ADP-ribosylglycohydrolase n=1 Tax=Glycomyces sambucus TaxID=380244 RepID=A0A1G9DLU1_9ACTN|nr:ADP-ribosylglycohydrolase family protein [Glycomyces sambucus]SDK64725.1 ADP-ribosylglycohydrolase [Glycomyces sambucus]
MTGDAHGSATKNDTASKNGSAGRHGTAHGSTTHDSTTRDSTAHDRAVHDRALGAFAGLALGDALGMPTQSMSPREIAEDYGDLDGLAAAGPRQRIAAGMPAGSVTDDTEQAVLLAELLIEHDGHLPADEFARRLLTWERDMIAKDSLDLLGPSTKAALQRLQDGEDPATTGQGGSTNGAAMRVTPVGIAVPFAPRTPFLDAVQDSARITHNSSLGLAAAAAVGAAVSAAIDGATAAEAVAIGADYADLAERRAHWAAGGRIGPRVRWAAALLRDTDPADHARLLIDLVGTSVAAQESVVAALALAAASTDPWTTLRTAARAGGDTDTVAAMAGAVLGAVHGAAAWPADALAVVQDRNRLDLASLCTGLLAVRERRRI